MASSDGVSAGESVRSVRRLRPILEWTVLIAAASGLVIAFVAVVFLAPRVFSTPSESMKPALEPGDRVVVSASLYDLRDPRRGDVVVFKTPAKAEAPGVPDLVKRIVGLPEERIEGRSGRILVDGERLDEPYLTPGTRSRTFGPLRVPRDRYFVLGDNRESSKDSVFFGPIATDDLVGPVVFRSWPLDRIHPLWVPLVPVGLALALLASAGSILLRRRARRRAAGSSA